MKKLMCILMLGMLAGVAHGADVSRYPERPIRLILPFPPGGGTDTFCRIISARMGETLGQQIIVDNRGGAQGHIGTALGARATPDGYTLTFAFVGTLAINPHMYEASFDPLKDFTAIARGTEDQWVLVVHPSVKVNTAQELATLARANPGKLNNGATSSAGQLLVDIFNTAAKVKIVHIPYKGAGPALLDLIAGNVQVSFPNPTGPMPHIKSGKLRALLVTGNRRHEALPDTPHALEAGFPDLDLTSWYGLAAPAATPRHIVQRLHAEANSALAHAETRQLLARAGQRVSQATLEEFNAQIRRDYERWGKAVKASGAKVQ